MQQRFAPHETDMVKVDEKLRKLRQIAPERMRILKRRGRQRTEMTASLATEIAMLDKGIFDLGQTGRTRPDSMLALLSSA